MAPLIKDPRSTPDRLIVRIPLIVEAVAEGRLAVVFLALLGLAVLVMAGLG